MTFNVLYLLGLEVKNSKQLKRININYPLCWRLKKPRKKLLVKCLFDDLHLIYSTLTK